MSINQLICTIAITLFCGVSFSEQRKFPIPQVNDIDKKNINDRLNIIDLNFQDIYRLDNLKVSKSSATDTYFPLSDASLLARTTGYTSTGLITVDGYTMLGSDAPKIKIKKLTGTSSADDAGVSAVAHGLDASKIISFTTILAYIANSYNQPHDSTPGYNWDTYSDTVNITVRNTAGSSANIRSKPFKILIIYEE